MIHMKRRHLPTRGAKTGQASKDETGEVPVTGREGDEGSQRDGEQRSQEVTRETTCALMFEMCPGYCKL